MESEEGCYQGYNNITERQKPKHAKKLSVYQDWGLSEIIKVLSTLMSP